MCSRIKSSFSGKIPEIPGIAVDNFEAHNLRSRAYFLSHCHSDHTKGLFSEDLLKAVAKNGVHIYMSAISAAIVADDCKGSSLMDSIKPLDLGTTHLTLPELFGYEESFVRVTLIQAGHCLGSVMFLFETKNQRILYTGDFNIRCNDICRRSSFHDRNKEPIHIDVMYVDTTFLDAKYEYFPKRSDVIQEALKYMKEWLSSDKDNKISLSMPAKYGYEYVFNEIYDNLGTKVYVSEDKWQFYREHPSISKGVTNNESETKIHACRDFAEGGNHKWCSLTDGGNFLFMRLSAMKWERYELDESAVQRVSDKRIDICFPTHCSRTEIVSFVNYFQPRKIVGFPNEYNVNRTKAVAQESSDVKLVSNGEGLAKKRKTESPKNKRPKLDRKVDKNVLRQIFDI